MEAEGMIKKLTLILIIGALIFSGFEAVALHISTAPIENNKDMIDVSTTETKNQVQTLQKSYLVSEPIFTYKKEYILPELKDSESLLSVGKPIIPFITKTVVLPLTTQIINTIITVQTQKYILSNKIEPAPRPYAPTTDALSFFTTPPIDMSVYSSTHLYPSQQYSVQYGAGLDNNEHVVFVNVKCYSQYSPALDEIYIPNEITVEVQYKDLSDTDVLNTATYDLLIITDEKLKTDDLQRLVDHKNSIGVKTILVTTQEIYNTPLYNGRFPAETIKKAVYDAILNWGIKYLLLFGGHKGQTDDWYVPVFRSNNYDAAVFGETGEPYDLTYASDLYYADAIRYGNDGSPLFDDWDRNGNGRFAEGPYYSNSIDYPDYYPDVYVGRIPIRYSWEIPIIVDKIIQYENNASDSWFKKAVHIAGDTSPPARDEHNQIESGIYEGEITCDVTAQYLAEAGFVSEKLYTSTGTFARTDDVLQAINRGCGWCDFQGHGNPAVWGNFLPDALTEDDFVYGFTIIDIRKLTNGEKLPFMLIDGCHNGQFDATLQQIIDSNGANFVRFNLLEWIPSDTSSWMLLQGGGGAIGVISTTALGYGYINEYTTAGLGGWIMPRFAYEFASQGKTYVGEIWGQGITDYINSFDVLHDEIDRKTIEERVLLGDPSLKLGGYNREFSTQNEDANTDTDSDDQDHEISASSVDVPTWEQGQKWTYSISDIDFSFHEITGRDIDVHFSSGDITVQVAEVTDVMYRLDFDTKNVVASCDIQFDPFNGKNATDIKIDVSGASLNGQIFVDIDTLAISKVTGTITVDFGTQQLLDLLNIQFGPLLNRLIPKLIPTIPFKVDLICTFDPMYELLEFPLDVEKTWGINDVNITIDGTVNSKFLTRLKLLNRLFLGTLVPPELVKYLSGINISQFLLEQNISNIIHVPKMDELLRKPPFTVSSMSNNVYKIDFVQGLAEIFYSSDVENIVEIQGNLHDFIPITDNIELKLKS